MKECISWENAENYDIKEVVKYEEETDNTEIANNIEEVLLKRLKEDYKGETDRPIIILYL